MELATHGQQYAMEAILQQFSKLCVESIVDDQAVNLEELCSVMGAVERQDVANLLIRCFKGTQVCTYACMRQITWFSCKATMFTFAIMITSCEVYIGQ